MAANSAAVIDHIGAADTMHPDFGTVWNGAPIGIPYVVVPNGQALLPIDFASPSVVADDVEEHLAVDPLSDHMLIAQCSYMLSPLVAELPLHPTPYHSLKSSLST